MKWLYMVLRRLLILLGLCLAGTLVSGALVRLAPGYGVDERELDPTWSAQSLQALRHERASKERLLVFYTRYLSGAIHGNLGMSESLGRPVSQLLRERFPVTRNSVLLGLGFAWAAAALLTLLGFASRGWVYEASSTALSGLFLSLPAAVVALLAVHLRAPVFVAIGTVVFPRLFRVVRNLLVRTSEQPHVLAARARGLAGCAILIRHILPIAAPPLLALLGVSFSMAFGAAIPIEALCDSPGLGQLAWQAALSRDLPLIVNLTLIVCLMTLLANSFADLAARSFAGETR
jgi:peptide/nickel transport system permease protein